MRSLTLERENWHLSQALVVGCDLRVGAGKDADPDGHGLDRKAPNLLHSHDSNVGERQPAGAARRPARGEGRFR
jgi:hypothetical protein